LEDGLGQPPAIVRLMDGHDFFDDVATLSCLLLVWKS